MAILKLIAVYKEDLYQLINALRVLGEVNEGYAAMVYGIFNNLAQW